MTGDDAYPLVELLRDRLGRAGLEKGDTVLAAGGEHLVARLLHLRRVGVARHLAIAERKGEIARPQLGKADPGDAEDLLAACDPFWAFELDAEQQFAPRVERPGIAELAVFGFRDAADRRRARFRTAATRAETKRLCLAGIGAVAVRTALAPHALQRGRREGIDTFEVMRVAAALDKGAHCAGRLGLAQQDAMHAAPEDLAELPGVVADIGDVGAVDRRLDNDCRRAVAGAGRASLDQALQIFLKPSHIEGAVLHADIDVIGPGAG